MLTSLYLMKHGSSEDEPEHDHHGLSLTGPHGFISVTRTSPTSTSGSQAKAYMNCFLIIVNSETVCASSCAVPVGIRFVNPGSRQIRELFSCIPKSEYSTVGRHD